MTPKAQRRLGSSAMQPSRTPIHTTPQSTATTNPTFRPERVPAEFTCRPSKFELLNYPVGPGPGGGGPGTQPWASETIDAATTQLSNTPNHVPTHHNPDNIPARHVDQLMRQRMIPLSSTS